MPPLGTVTKPLLLEFRNAWSRQLRALYFQMVFSQVPQKPPSPANTRLHTHAPWVQLAMANLGDTNGRCCMRHSLRVFFPIQSPVSSAAQ